MSSLKLFHGNHGLRWVTEPGTVEKSISDPAKEKQSAVFLNEQASLLEINLGFVSPADSYIANVLIVYKTSAIKSGQFDIIIELYFFN